MLKLVVGERLYDSFQGTQLRRLICIMLFNMNNQIQACSKQQIHGLQAQHCCIAPTPHSDIHSFFDHSSIYNFKSQLEPDHFSLINSFSPIHISLSIHQDSTLLFSQRMPNSIDLTHFETVTLPYLTLGRGTSENYQCLEEEQRREKQHLFDLPQAYSDQPYRQPQQSKEQDQSEMSPSFLSYQSSEQDFKSNNNYPSPNQLNSHKCKGKAGGSQLGLKVTKNVTKNIGKLLFKFIWKNRQTLGKEMGLEPLRWKAFMDTISSWKKENNITRQFLISRWHAAGQEAQLFRIISRHFFRKRCLPAIINSHIRLKKVHYERVSRFSAAITDPNALHSIA